MIQSRLTQLVRQPLAVAFAALILAACGGGGGSTTPPVTPGPVSDTTAPEITLVGSSTMTHEQGTEFSDPGYSASDNVDSNLTVSVDGEVNTAVAGEYSITYSTSDSAGNSTSETRTVTVVDTTVPVITLSGDAEVSVQQGDAYTDAGATASDSADGEVAVVTSGSVDANTAGQYVITYTATDVAGNQATLTRTVTVDEIDTGVIGGIAGDWRLSPVANALGVGPSQGDISWWSSSEEDVNGRGCLFDDIYRFAEDGSFSNLMEGSTWVEQWQGGADSCGTPVAPHDGSNAATYTYNETAATLTLQGLGAHIGLSKAFNGGELASPADAVESIVYSVVEMSATEMTLDIEIANGAYWRFMLTKLDNADIAPDLSILDNGVASAEWDTGIVIIDEAKAWGRCDSGDDASCPSASWTVVNDADRGNVLQISHAPAAQLGFVIVQTSTPYDLSAYAGGTIEFDVKIISGDSNLTIKSECTFPCTSGDFALGAVQGNDWVAISVNVNDLVDQGLSLSAVDIGLAIWATNHDSTVFQIDNVRWVANPNGPTFGTGNTGGTISEWVKADPSIGYVTPTEYAGYNLVWADEFNGTDLDTTQWKFDIGTGSNGWGNNELEYYTENNVSVENGLLVIEARKETFGGRAYTSSRIKTQDNFSFKYGRVDARAVVAEGKGLWSAIWMLGQNFAEVSWPHSGEIDIVDTIGGPGNENSAVHNVYWNNGGVGAAYSPASAGTNHVLSGGETYSDTFHVFSIEWTEDQIIWYVDDVQSHVVDVTDGSDLAEAVRAEFFLILNVAVGGNWPGTPITSTQFPRGMLVDYVRVFQKTAP